MSITYVYRTIRNGISGGAGQAARGVSQGKTLPAYFEEPQIRYGRTELTAENAASIPCKQVLGTYIVRFNREQ